MSEANGTHPSVTMLLGHGLTPGKLLGLQRISNPDGTLTMLALDQNSSMISMMKKAFQKAGQDREPTYEEITDAKLDLIEALAPHASALLIDAVYGAWNAVASFRLPRTTGLLVRVEMSGAPKNDRGGILGQIEPGWSVAQIKRMGANAVKLLAQFEPLESQSAEHQFHLIETVYEECRKHDILMLLEPTSFQFTGESKTSDSYLKRKPQTVIESARQLSQFCDVYKAEFPGTLGKDSDRQLRDNLVELNRASCRPWVLLSAGVDYPEYETQVGMAMDAGANGVLGGRAFWKEFFEQKDRAARMAFAKQEAVRRLTTVGRIVQQKGQPWYAHYGLTLDELRKVRAVEGWQFRYGAPESPRAVAAEVREGDVY